MPQQVIKEKNLTPQQIVEELNKYIIGQNEAKRSVAIALRNRWRRMNADEEIRDEILPNNILLIGPTGVGKTEISRRLASLANAPFIKVEASKFTEVGYMGRDVESMIRDLTDIAINKVKKEMQERVKEKAKKIVEDRILDILIPPVQDSNQNGTGFNGNDGDFDPDQATDQELNKRTREKFRQKLRNGELEDREIEIEVQSNNAPMMQVFGPQGGMEEMGVNLQDMLGNMAGNNTSTRHVTIEEAREILLDQEAEKLIDHDVAVEEAIERVERQGIVFIDEIDKVASDSSDGKNGGGADVSRQGVQRDMLPIIEGTTVKTKYGMVQTEHILFIGSGAFHVSKPSDMIPELQGRMPIRVELDSLTEEDFFDILTLPKNALTKQYQAMLKAEGVNIEFTDDAIREIASIAAQVNNRVENIGARRLHTILSTLLDELLFAVPNDISSGDITIDKEYVNKQLDDLVKDKDLSHYIL
ncbi:MAG TPA: ATP-dependent protease ATPase subunit HslU [Balneolaceae bacterium]|nr:ATP-dependent protease ATPase subunit HslU [Balneolaceae bacterium]